MNSPHQECAPAVSRNTRESRKRPRSRGQYYLLSSPIRTSKKHVRSHLTEAIENFRAEGPSCYSPGCSESASAGPGAIIPQFTSEACKADIVVTSPSKHKHLFEVIEQKKRPNRRPQFLKQLVASVPFPTINYQHKKNYQLFKKRHAPQYPRTHSTTTRPTRSLPAPTHSSRPRT